MFKNKVKMTDMTQGNAYRLIIAFSIPLLIGNIFQQMYNMVDSIVVGNWIGAKALAAVGTGFPIIFMMCSLFMGIGAGATVMVSQFYGAKDFDKLSKTVGTIYTAMIIGIIPLSILSILVTEPLLKLIQVPMDGTLEMAKSYLIVIFIGMIGMLGFNVNAGILQGFGDSKTSLLFLLIACMINIVLDLVFTICFGMGVMGVALATIIGQISSWVFGIFYINKHYTMIHINIFSFFFDKKLFIKAMKLGIPSGIQQAMFSLGIMMMQSLVNSFGSIFMAGFNGANKIDTFAFMPIQSFAIAATTFTGQNVGANNYDRVRYGMRSGNVLSIATCIVIGALIYPASGFLMRMFSQDAEVISAGVSYLHSVLPAFPLLAILFMTNSVLGGSGQMIIPLISTFVGLWLVRVPSAYLIAHYWGRDYIFLSYAIGWIFSIIISCGYYATGRWKKQRVVEQETLKKVR